MAPHLGSGSDGGDPDVDATRAESRSATDGTRPLRDETPERGAQIGRYIVVDRLGAGGMGEVLRAYDPELDRRVAIKLLHVGARTGRARARERMLREAQAMAKLSHPNVVAVFDAGTHGDRVFIAMEYIEGETLGAWLKGRPRSWKEVVEVMMRAGRGLAAAHAAGLVHRDFKPANVMIGADAPPGQSFGRVCVLDFGLARRFDDPSGDAEDPEPVSLEATSSGSASAPRFSGLTETGMVMGTPAFMAPEQFFGGPIDARTDQFAFCVVLFRALHGVAPFPGRSFEELGRAVEKGRIADVPATARVPRRLRAVLERGLRVAADERFASMDLLLDALQVGRRGRGRMIAVGAGAIALAGGLALLARPGVQPCAGAEQALAGAWDEDRRERVTQAFAAVGAAYGDDALRGATAQLDRYTDAWVAMRTDACEATRVRGDQSESLMDRRVACLDARRRELAALTDLLAVADAQVVENAVDAVSRLRPLDACADTETLLQEVPPPSDPAVAAAVQEVRDALADARAMSLAGKFDPSHARTSELYARAIELGYRPLVAESAVLLGAIEERRGKPEAAVQALEEGLFTAMAIGDSRVEAEAAIGLSSVEATLKADSIAAMRQLRHARAVLERIGNPPVLFAHTYLYSGTAHLRARRWDEAEADYVRALELVGDLPEGQRVKLAALSNLATAQGLRGNFRASLKAQQEALALVAERLGEHHPQLANIHNNMGATYSRMGDGESALESQRQALAISLASVGSDHPDVARAYHNLGVALATMGDEAGALEAYLHAAEIKRKALGPRSTALAHSLNNAADSLIRLKRYEEARGHVDEALAIWTSTSGEDVPEATYALTSLAELELGSGRPKDGVQSIREALRIASASNMEPLERARMELVAAQVLWAAGEDKAEAVRYGESARDRFRSPERDSSPELARAEAWLAGHRAPAAKTQEPQSSATSVK